MGDSTSTIKYRVGFDVGSRSLGMAAIEVDDHGMPVKILNAMSLIHDGGLDPDSNKTALTRKKVSGVARRTRRMYRRRKKRLTAVDDFLRAHGFPIEDLGVAESGQAWRARAELATDFIEDEAERRRKFAIAVRHIARHRGWRNPYTLTKSLYVPAQPSSNLLEIKEQFKTLLPETNVAGLTVAQMVVALPDGTKRLRGKNGLFTARLHQKDVATELIAFSLAQGMDRGFINELIDHVFSAQSPKGSAKEQVGKDALDPSQPRAWRAVREFQEYRIISLLANVRIRDHGCAIKNSIRPLSVEERQRAFDFLRTPSPPARPTWVDVAEVLGIDRGHLLGTATSTDDGERVSGAPPINETELAMASSTIKEIREFWKTASQDSKDALVREFSNVDAPEDDSPAAIEAASRLRTLSEESLEKLESLRLPDGRSAYSEKTLANLTEHMLNNVADLSDARMAVFGVAKDWKPKASPIAEPTGNPAVDRVLKGVNRWLEMSLSRWGEPESINIETLRDGFKSEKTAREIERDQDKRALRNQESMERMRSTLGLEGKVRRSELMRFQSIQRQNGQCAYCGSLIDFKSAELDHIVPRAGVGATNARYNLLAVCGRCNREKGKLPFAVWARRTSIPDVSLEKAIERVNQWPQDPGLKASDMKRFQKDVILRLRRESEDEALDARSKEAVSWMAVELHNRIHGRFPVRHEGGEVKVQVFRGEVTASARRAAGIDNSFRLIGGKTGKNRLDRRHHAIDAAVIALMQGKVAQVLTERNSLRAQQFIDRIPDPAYGAWQDFEGRTVADINAYRAWKQRMKRLVPMLQAAIDEDSIPVVENIRLRLGNGLAHEETIHPLQSIKLGDELPVNLIDRAATPALWTALTREPDFDWKTGLPADPKRQIRVNGSRFTGNDPIEFFPVSAGAMKVRGGYVELGSAFHHARLYRIKGKTDSFAMVRVYTVDLLRARHENLFTYELHPNTMSMRQTEPKLRKAIRDGNAEYVTWLVVGDELFLDAAEIATGQVATFIEEFGEVTRWRVRGFFSDSKLRLKPSQFSTEFGGNEVSGDSRKIIDSPGWRPAVNRVFGPGNGVIIRRDAHGRVRLGSEAGLPRSVKVAG
ncbi:CRISPR-associated endonuclease Cas9 [Corynebacterium auris]|nr:CRISPR-associated endonuclease Cas9 [Corynebacterium auris]